MKELVSIVIPTYKRPGMLERAINSCLKQTYKNIEIILIDDNNPNTEGRKLTEEFVKKHENNEKIKYVRMEKNGGGCLARNRGVRESNGTYIAFLDDDDYFFETKIEEQLKYMIDNNLDASFTGSETFDETKNQLIKVKRYTNFGKYDDILKFHLVEMIVSPQTFMYKKDVFLQIGGFDIVPAGHEYYLMYKTIINNYKIGYLNNVLTRICIHSGERITTGKNKIIAEKFLYDLKRKHFDILNYKQKRFVKYIYKYNVWQRYNSSKNFKSFLWLFYILLTHPILLLKRKILKELKI